MTLTVEQDDMLANPRSAASRAFSAQADHAASSISLGAVLKSARAEKDLSLDDVAAQTNISLYVLKAFESGASLKVASIYSRGYLRTLAQLLDLDGPALISLFERKNAHRDRSDGLHVSELLNNSDQGNGEGIEKADSYRVDIESLASLKKTFQDNICSKGAAFWRAGALAAIPMVCLCVLAFAYHSIQDEFSAGRSVAEIDGGAPADQLGVLASEALISREAAQSPVLEAPAYASRESVESYNELSVIEDTRAVRTASASLVEAPGAAQMVDLHQEQDRLVIDVLQDSWIDVRDSEGNRLYRNLARAGRRIDVSGELPFAIHVGNVPGLALQLNGEPVAIDRIRPDNSARLTLASN